MFHRIVTIGVGLATAAALSGCLPQPVGMPFGVPAGTIVCEGGAGTVTVSPGVDVTARPQELALTAPSTRSNCQDGTSTGVTSARIDDLSLSFASLDCSGGAIEPATASGTASIVWSDGSSSDAQVEAELGGVLTGTLRLAVTSGHFAGMSGSTAFVATPSQGDCVSGITREAITIQRLVLAPAHR